MAQQVIFLGTNPNDGTGESLRGAGGMVNNMFTELYALQSQTINAGAVAYDAATTPARLNLAIADAVATNKTRVFIPAAYLPYDASLVNYNTAARLVREGGSYDVFDVLAYGAAGDGATDDTTAIQAAIDATEAALGGIVYFPPLNFKITATLTVQQSSVNLIGSGTFYNADVGSIGTGTQLQWGGVAGGTMLQLSAIAGASNQALKAVTMEKFLLRGLASAGIGLQIFSLQGGHISELFIQDCTTVGLDLNVVSPLGENAGLTRSLFERINIRQVNPNPSPGIGIRMNGNATANVSNNDFLNISVVHMDGVGVKMLNCDSNRFYGLNVNRAAPGSGIGVELNGSAIAEQHCRVNSFIWLEPGLGGVVSRGTGLTAPAQDNMANYYSVENGEPLPTIETGSTFFYNSSTNPQPESELVFCLNQTITNMAAGDAELADTTSYRLKTDLRSRSQFRFIASVGVAGATGADLRIQYSTNGGSSFADELDGAAGPELDIGTTGIKDTGWVNIVSAARINNCVLRVVAKEGDGAADPAFSARLYLR